VSFQEILNLPVGSHTGFFQAADFFLYQLFFFQQNLIVFL
jgi:hypothetical protein